MKVSQHYVVPLRRKSQGRTDYRKRLKLLQGRAPRLVIRKFAHTLSAQIIDYAQTGDVVQVCATTHDLVKLGWKSSGRSIPAAYLCGLLLAKRAKHKKINEAIVDIGLSPTVKGSRLFAVAKGALDGGLNVPVGKEILPSEERILGKHIAAYAKQLSPTDLEKHFSKQCKTGVKPADLPAHVSEVKKKIMEL